MLVEDLLDPARVPCLATLLGRADPPTAVVAFNDRCATGVLDTLLHRCRSVPADFSVVGYDDSRLARTANVQLTTVSQDAGLLADTAIEGAITLISVGDPCETVLVPELARHATTGPAAT
jgi:LacI family transcriptional regulator